MRPLGRRILIGFIALLLGVYPMLLRRPQAVNAAGQPSLVDETNAITTQALQQLSSSLPSDPALAATALVKQIYSSDELSASLAVAELLRRSGFAIVSPDGPVIGVPDHYVLNDIPIYTGFIPTLARSVRGGDSYSTDQMTQLLTAIGATPDPLPAKVLIGTLGQWGKSADDPPEIRLAAAAIRALSAYRGQIAYPEADPQAFQFDPLTATLIIANVTSRVGTILKPTSSVPGSSPLLAYWEQLMGVTTVYASNPCDDLKNITKDEGQVGETARTWYQDQLKESWTEKLPSGAAQNLEKTGYAWDKGSAALSSILLMLGARIEISDDHGAQTHFRHEPGDESRNVKVTAVASFDSAFAKAKLACYQLAGIDVPPSGPLKGFRVRWSISQDIGVVGNTGYQGKYLAVVSADDNKLQDGELTGDNGKSSITLYPPTEEKPGEGKLHKGYVTVKASLDKDDFPFKLADLLSLTDVPLFTVSKLFDLAKSALTKAGLPWQRETITVGYHGSDVYLAKGTATFSGLFFYSGGVPVTLDLYTCDGLGGPWKGTFDMKGISRTAFLQTLGALTGASGGDEYTQNMNFNVPVQGGPFDIVNNLSGLIQIDKVPNENQHFDGIVGQVELLLDGGVIPDTFLTQSVDVPVKGVPQDARCPGGGYYFENE